MIVIQPLVFRISLEQIFPGIRIALSVDYLKQVFPGFCGKTAVSGYPCAEVFPGLSCGGDLYGGGYAGVPGSDILLDGEGALFREALVVSVVAFRGGIGNDADDLTALGGFGDHVVQAVKC